MIVYDNNNIIKEWMKSFNCKVIDLSDMEYENDYFPTSECDHHNRTYRPSCAQHNVKQIKQFVNEHRDRKRKYNEEFPSNSIGLDIVG